MDLKGVTPFCKETKKGSDSGEIKNFSQKKVEYKVLNLNEMLCNRTLFVLEKIKKLLSNRI